MKFKGIVLKNDILLSFTHLHVVPNMYEFEHKRRYFEECW